MTISSETEVSPDELIDQWMAVDLDSWTRRVIARHFDKESGSLYWLFTQIF